MFPGVGEGVRGGIQLAAFFTTHTLDHLLSQFGYAAVFAFLMVESLGVPFPGETMLITAALYASLTHHLVVWLVWAGRGSGRDHRRQHRVRNRVPRRLPAGSALREEAAHRRDKAEVGRLLFDRHGGKVVFFGRFVSILRTYAAFLAGVNRMAWHRFFLFNAAGAIVWSGPEKVADGYGRSWVMTHRDAHPLRLTYWALSRLARVEMTRRSPSRAK